MTTTQRQPRGRAAGYRAVNCRACGKEIDKRLLYKHQRFECEHVIRRETGVPVETPPGTIIGVGPAQYKKPWSWADLERAYPRETWVSIPAQSNPPGGITWNRLHVELVPIDGGCFMTTGPRNGERPIYSRTIPPPHWDVYQQSLATERQVAGVLARQGFGITASPQVGTLEPQVFVDKETGERLVWPSPTA